MKFDLTRFKAFIKPQEKNIHLARHEYMTKIIVLFMSIIMILSFPFFLIGYVNNIFESRTIIILILLTMSLIVLLILNYKGKWKITSYAFVCIFFLISVIETVHYGVGATNIVITLLTILFAAFLREGKCVVIIILVSIFVNLFSNLLHYNTGRVSKEDAVYWIIMLNFFYILLGLLLRFYTDQFKKTLSDLFKYTKELDKSREELIESKDSQEKAFLNMSHELRTPLNAVIGITQLLLNIDLNTEQREYINALQISSENILVIINEILDFSKVKSKKIKLARSEFNLQKLIDDISYIMKYQAQEKNIDLEVQIDKNIPLNLIGDDRRLNQIIVNLVNNAIKFTHQGKVEIKVDLIYIENKNARIQFTIKDTGLGIPKSKFATIFKSYEQLVGETDGKYEGTGLGLAIVKNLVVAMNGEIDLESEIDKGSVFKVVLEFPIAKKLVKKKNYLNEYDIVGKAFKLMRDKSILVVEDNKFNQFVLCNILKSWGAYVRAVNSAYGVIDIVQNYEKIHFDIVLMDLKMPGIDGFEAAKFIREQTDISWAFSPIIAVTATISEKEKEKAFKCCMDGFLTKPYTAQSLFEAIEKLIK